MKCKTLFHPSSDDPGLDTGPGLTEQNHMQAADINYIIEKFTQIGQLPNTGEPQFGDFADAGDFLDCQLRIKEAETSFMQLDAKIRQRFNNNPADLINALSDPSRESELIELGVLNPKPITPV